MKKNLKYIILILLSFLIKFLLSSFLFIFLIFFFISTQNIDIFQYRYNIKIPIGDSGETYLDNEESVIDSFYYTRNLNNLLKNIILC